MAAKFRIILLCISLFFLAIGLAWLAFDDRKKGKPEAGSAEQLAQARKAKAKKAQEAAAAAEIENEINDILNDQDNGSKEETNEPEI